MSESLDNQIKTGSCLCGQVKFETSGPLRPAVACHCTQCRKASGHFTAATATSPENLHLICDTGLKWYRSSAVAQRGFCGDCGSTLFWKPDSGDRISVYVGSIDDQTNLVLDSHIFVEEKGDYYQVEDGAPQYQKGGANLSV